MATFTVNGRTVTTEKNQKLIRFLRDELRLTSVKDGCSEGACGTCTILVDGKAVRACVLTTDRADGKTILTAEGLSEFEKEAYARGFGEAGAVQCGFCIPGMVMAAKGLLDQNPDPGEEEIKNALRTNICRCTGYVKIIEGVRLTAKILREGRLPRREEDWRRSRGPGCIPTTSIWRGCSTPPPSVPPTPGPSSGPFTPRRPCPCPAWRGCSPPRTSRGRTRWATW